MTPITRNREIERLERELVEKDAQITKLTSQLRAIKDFNKVHQEQHAQSRENAQLLYTTLRNVAPDALKSIEGTLWQNTTEYDKLMSEGRRWQEKCQQSARELAESREECRRLTERGSLIEWAIECAAQWRIFVQSDDEDDAALEAFKVTMNVLVSKVSEYSLQRLLAPKAGDK